MTGTHSPQPGLCRALCLSGRVPRNYARVPGEPALSGGQVAPAQCVWDETEAQMAAPGMWTLAHSVGVMLCSDRSTLNNPECRSKARTPGHEREPPHRTRSSHGGVAPTAPSASLRELSIQAVRSPAGGQLPTPVGGTVGTGHGRLPSGGGTVDHVAASEFRCPRLAR